MDTLVAFTIAVAITLFFVRSYLKGLKKKSMGADMPRLTPGYETTIQNLFIVGELGGLALIKNAVNQGRDCVDTIAARLARAGTPKSSDVYDVLIIGAGPSGISASLRAIEKN